MPYTKKGERRNTGKTHFSIGYIPWNKDRKNIYSKETLEKISLGARRKKPEHSAVMKGRVWSKARRNAQKAREGKPYNGSVRKRKLTKSIVMHGKEYSPLWHEIRRDIYKRDNWTCRSCGKKCHNRVKIQCHHIDYNISNNASSNLITLCASCHMKTNFKRQDWVQYFRYKQSEEI